MAYDPVAAHEYYIKYRKKGLLKGRKKGKKKTTTSKKRGRKSAAKKQNLIGLSTGGLNDTGKMQWAMAKESLTTQMNQALSKAKTDQEKLQIRQEFQNKALEQLQKIKSDPSAAKQKATSTKSSGSKKSSGSSKSSFSKSSSSKSSSGSSSSAATEKLKATVEELNNTVAELSKTIQALTQEQKTQVKESLNTIIQRLMAERSNKQQ